MSDDIWSRTAGKMREIHTEELGETLRVCVDEIGADVVVIDWREATSAFDALAVMATRLGFPDYFGSNLDALYDVASGRAAAARPEMPPQVWLIKSSVAQQKQWFSIKDTLQDAMSDAAGVAVTILWWVV